MAPALAALVLPAPAQPMGERGLGGAVARHSMMAMMGDPAGYLDGLKARLKITTAQEDAPATYAAVEDHVTQMQAAHKTMFEAMCTATWQERRDKTAVHNAADKLIEVPTPAQKSQATRIPPGMMGPAILSDTRSHDCRLPKLPGWAGHIGKFG